MDCSNITSFVCKYNSRVYAKVGGGGKKHKIFPFLCFLSCRPSQNTLICWKQHSQTNRAAPFVQRKDSCLPLNILLMKINCLLCSCHDARESGSIFVCFVRGLILLFCFFMLSSLVYFHLLSDVLFVYLPEQV